MSGEDLYIAYLLHIGECGIFDINVPDKEYSHRYLVKYGQGVKFCPFCGENIGYLEGTDLNEWVRKNRNK